MRSRVAWMVGRGIAVWLAGCLTKPPPPGETVPAPDARLAGDSGSGGGPPSFVMFVTSAVFHPPMVQATANGFCTMGANEHGHPGAFVAWMSYESTNSNAIDELRTFGGPWYRTDGALFAQSADAIAQGMIAHAPQFDEMGNDVLQAEPSVQVATGTQANGDYDVGFNGDCMNNHIEIGVPDMTTAAWTATGYTDCMLSTGLRVYCFQVGP